MRVPRLPLAAITDEFSPLLSEAIPIMKEVGMTAAELRTIEGKNILDLSHDQLRRAKEQLDEAELKIVSIASPLLKCVLEGGPALDRRFAHDIFASQQTMADQPRLTERAIEVALFFDTRLIRVFSYWRTLNPGDCLDAIAEALQALTEIAGRESLFIGLENEHACNVATATETARVMDLLATSDVKIVWDPANALVAGESPFPYGYEKLPKDRIIHVHAKDCDMLEDIPEFGPLGTRHIAWKEQIAKLIDDGYRGYLSLETHWKGPEENKLEASRICGWNLRGLACA